MNAYCNLFHAIVPSGFDHRLVRPGPFFRNSAPSIPQPAPHMPLLNWCVTTTDISHLGPHDQALLGLAHVGGGWSESSNRKG